MQNLMSPLGNTPNYGFSQQQSQQQPTPQQQQRQQYNSATKNSTMPQSQPMNLNSITPANILSMSMTGDPLHQQQQQNKKEFDPLDFNNLDFGNLNMDMI